MSSVRTRLTFVATILTISEMLKLAPFHTHTHKYISIVDRMLYHNFKLKLHDGLANVCTSAQLVSSKWSKSNNFASNLAKEAETYYVSVDWQTEMNFPFSPSMQMKPPRSPTHLWTYTAESNATLLVDYMLSNETICRFDYSGNDNSRRQINSTIMFRVQEFTFSGMSLLSTLAVVLAAGGWALSLSTYINL